MAQQTVDQRLRDTRIAQIAKSRMVQASPDVSIQEAVRIMQDAKRGYIMLTENNRVTGILTETDVTHRLLRHDVDWSQPVSTVMTKNPVALKPSDKVGLAMDLMGARRFYHIPLVNDQQEFIGVLSVRALIRLIAEFYPNEVLNLPPNPDLILDTREGG